MFDRLARLLFGAFTAMVGLGLGLPSLAEREASQSPAEYTCRQLLTDRPEGWVRITGCQLDLAAALYEEDPAGVVVTQAWIPADVAPVPADGSPAPLVVRTSEPQTLERLAWGRDAVRAAEDDPQALRNVLETFQQAGSRHLTGRLTWFPTPRMRAEVQPLATMLTSDAGHLHTRRPPWMPGWGWTLVGVLGVALAAWTGGWWIRERTLSVGDPET